MRILMLVPFLPNSSTSGGQTRWYNIIKYLARKHKITLFSLIKDESEKNFIPELEKYCKRVVVFKRPSSPWTVRNLILTAFSWYPLLVIRNFSLAERKVLKEELSRAKYDLIHAEAFYVMPHLPDTKIPTILVEQTIEYLVYKHFVIQEVPKILRPIFMIDILKLRFWEKYYWKKATRLVSVSSEDKKIMQREIPGIKVDLIPNGIDYKYFSKRIAKRKDPPRVLYGVANFKWLQNIEALHILLKEIWPKVIKAVPKAKLWIVGRKIPLDIINISKFRNNIEVTESIVDQRKALDGASLAVLPLKGPGGTRLKILEAFAAGLPVISTSIGVAGLKIKRGYHALIEDRSPDLVKATIRLLKNKDLAEQIGRNGKNFVKRNYDWEIIVKLHDTIYADTFRN